MNAGAQPNRRQSTTSGGLLPRDGAPHRERVFC